MPAVLPTPATLTPLTQSCGSPQSSEYVMLRPLRERISGPLPLPSMRGAWGGGRDNGAARRGGGVVERARRRRGGDGGGGGERRARQCGADHQALEGMLHGELLALGSSG